jgi:outer membrane murein-binding lipoprotein Lpp
MIKAMQELSAKIDALETENTALKARVTTLEG